YVFAYGEEVGDSVLLAKDDACGEPLSILPMPIFGRKYNTLYVCSNGLVSFQSKYANPNPSSDIKSYLGYSFLAPYYTDLESNTNATKGNIFYQLYDVIRNKRMMNNSNVLYVQRILDELEGEKGFNATIVFIVTWYRISPYPANKRGDESVSFQLVLTSDGTNTFVLYRYFPGEMKLRRNDVLIGYHFSTGEFKVHLNSFKMEALDMDQNTDTNGVVGLLLYRLTAVGSSLSNFDLQCLEWYESNKPYQLEYERKSKEMPACPCNSRWVRSDPWLGFPPQLAVSAVNTSCFIAAPCMKFQPHGKICCFDTTTGEWLSYAPRAGGFIKYHPITRKKDFESEDVQMKKICCEQSDYCYLYYALRPVGECYSKFPFNSALSWGDPHIETLDAKQYTFNGWGEFTLLSVTTENTSFILQGRTDKATTNAGMAVEATSFTAFAARYNNESSIHVEMNAERNGTYVYGNGIDYSLDFANMTKAFYVSTDTLTLSRSSDTNSLNVLFSSTADPVALIISVGAEMLALGITLPPIFKNKTKGLLGNYDGNPSNDFVYPNGTRLAEKCDRKRNILLRIKFIQDSESVFKYPNEKGHADFHHGNFTPKYLVEATESQLREASLKCGNNTACVYDLIMTNSVLVAEHTKEVAEQALKEKEETANTNPSIESNATSTLYVTMYQTVNLKFHASDDGPVTFLFQSNTVEAEFTYSDTNTAEANVTIYREDQCDLSVTAKDKQGYYAPAINFDFVLCDGCSGHGSCDYNSFQTNDKPCSLKKAKCVCDPYWEGTSCQLDFDGCRGRPCSLDRNCSDVEASIHKRNGVAFRCSPCPEGYLENGYKCQDIDECNSSLKMCNQICMNTFGSFLCLCENGYKLGIDQRTCEDIDECEEDEDDCDQNCTNDVGHYTCGCFDGFEYNVTLKTCIQTEIPNVCETSSINCSQTAGCTSFNRTAKCFCDKGLQLTSEGTKCEDIDECISNPCSQNCSNFNGGFSCHCYQGYTLEKDRRTCVECKYPKHGKDCSETCQCGKHGLECNPVKGCICDYGWRGRNCDSDIDECFENPDRCGNSYEVCENFPGSFTCRCKAGFERSDDGKCQDIDECSIPELNKCSQLCINNPGGFTCNCQRGYVIHPKNSFECIDVNECEIGTSGCEQICENVPGQFNCYCHYGYRLLSDRRTCVKEKNICALLGNFTCSHICLVENKKIKCECENGYTLTADNRTCKDINECLPSMNKCSQPHNCVNLDGSFSCLCDEGYRLDNDGITCRECDGFHFGKNCVNECNCGIGMDKCDKKEGCICKSGWKGSQCDIDINECKETNIPCSGKKNVCLNTPGSHRCLCEDGYVRDNSSADCMDLNECNDTTLNDCDQICINTDGSYMCSCNKGFALQGGRCIDIDECGKNNTCQHACENTPGGYRCLCHVGFKVDVGNITQCKPRIECHENETTYCESKGAQCALSNGVAICQCSRGLQWNNETNACIDVKDCDSKARCSQICKEEIGGYSCECSDGFLLREDTYTCTECYNNTYGSGCNQTCQCIVENAANASQTCNHLNGTCICKPGWQDTCDEDIDECKLNPLICSKIPNTGCLNTIGSYECACLRDHILQNASCILDNRTKLPPPNYGESAVPMTITLNVNVSDSLNLDVMATYQYLSNAAKSTLETFYRKRMGDNLGRIVITSLARGSLIVAYSIYVRNAPEVVANLTMTNAELASGASLTFENSSVSVDNVTVNGIKVPSNPSEDDLCRLYQNSFVSCSNGYECKVMSGIPSCKEIPVFPIEPITLYLFYIIITVPIAIAVPFGALIIIAIIVILCLIRHRQRKAKSDFEDIDRHQYNSIGSIVETETSSKSSVETRSKSPSLGRDMRNMHPELSVSSKYSFEGTVLLHAS
ncbi:hypothetical protein ACJMK2_021957, partial [Sinanodonta woodiana]